MKSEQRAFGPKRLGIRLVGPAIAIAIAAAGCGGGSGEGPRTTDGAGSAAAEIDAQYITGEGPKTIADAKGKVVILDFWATYCQPCRKSFPKYQALVEEFGGELAVIAVAVDEADEADEEKIKDFAKQTGVSFTILWDKEHKTAAVYNPPKMPTAFVIDKEGNIRHKHAGYQAGEEENMAEEVAALVKK
jgi:peroxiredoxin